MVRKSGPASIYETYLEVVCPLVTTYEVLTGEYPVPIANEIRAIFTHLARCNRSDSSVSYRQKESRNARRHLQRVLRDCFKYVCIAYDDAYKEFSRLYCRVDLTTVDNGNFLPELSAAYAKARNSFIAARHEECAIRDDLKVLNLYQDAMIAYEKVYNLISGQNLEKFVRLKRRRFWSEVIKTFFAVIGVAASIITIFQFIIHHS